MALPAGRRRPPRAGLRTDDRRGAGTDAPTWARAGAKGRISLMSLIFWRNFCLSGRQRTEAPSAATAPKSIREASYRRSYADSFTLATCFYPCLSGRSRWRFYGFPRHRLTIPPADVDPSRLPWRFFMCMGYSKQRLAFYSEVSSLHRGAMSDGLYRQPVPV